VRLYSGCERNLKRADGVVVRQAALPSTEVAMGRQASLLEHRTDDMGASGSSASHHLTASTDEFATRWPG